MSNVNKVTTSSSQNKNNYSKIQNYSQINKRKQIDLSSSNNPPGKQNPKPTVKTQNKDTQNNSSNNLVSNRSALSVSILPLFLRQIPQKIAFLLLKVSNLKIRKVPLATKLLK